MMNEMKSSQQTRMEVNTMEEIIKSGINLLIALVGFIVELIQYKGAKRVCC